MKLLVFADSLEHYRFFRRLHSPLAVAGAQLEYFSHRLSVCRVIRRDGCKGLLLRSREKDRNVAHDIGPSFEVQYGLLDKKSADQMVSGVMLFLHEVRKEYDFDCIFIWNGSQLVGRAMAAFAKNEDVKTLFFEIGNFPGKMVVDPAGVNIRSWYADNFAKFRGEQVNITLFNLWRESYLQDKLQTHVVPQSRNVKNFNWRYLEDLYGFYLCNALTSEKPAVLKRTWNYLASKKIIFDYDVFNPEQEKFLFFPLQVSTDSQLLWNSDVDNLQAIKIASKRAEAEGLRLVVKPHPAEADRVFVKDLLSLKASLGFLFVNTNTFQLIKHCQKVITINSTVGLEAKLMGRPVELLGRALYADFDEEDIARYIQDYLVDIDYFSEVGISADAANVVLSRAVSGHT